ncbi:MAG TPA: LLM class flavin-dependent oxidoreductase [Ktedonobacterales bacterium]
MTPGASPDTMVPHPWVAEGQSRIRFGVNGARGLDWLARRDLVQTLESLGFDSYLLPDHPLSLGTATWTTLAALAEATSTIRLGTLVSCVYYWNPVVLARAAADVDRISDGRVVLGLGSRDREQEFQQLGVPYPPAPERQAALEEAIQIVRPLLRGQTVQYQGQHFRANEAVLHPPPLQQPHIPLLIAGGGERTSLRFAAQYADASNLGASSWAGGAFGSEGAQHKLAVLRRHCEELGRSYDSLLPTCLVGMVLTENAEELPAKLDQIAPWYLSFMQQLFVTGTPEEAIAWLRARVAVGFRYFFVAFAPLGTGSEEAVFDNETLDLLVKRVIPAVIGGERLGGEDAATEG